MSVQKSIARSSAAFTESVWPVIGPHCGGGRVVPVEAVTNAAGSKDLDVMAGIDAWQVIDGDGVMRGVASRVQWPRRPQSFDTFTIRYALTSGHKTEYAKRVYALRHREHGYMYPHLTIQAYIHNDDLLSVAAVETISLYRVAWRCVQHQRAQRKVGWGFRPAPDGNQFLWMSWDFLNKNGCTTKIIRPRPVKNAAQREIFA